MWLLNQIDQTCCILRNLTTVHSQYTRVYGQKRFFCEHVRWERVFQCISICIFLLWAFFHVWRSFAFLFDISFILFFYFFFSFILKIVLFTLSSCLLFFPLLSFFFFLFYSSSSFLAFSLSLCSSFCFSPTSWLIRDIGPLFISSKILI